MPILSILNLLGVRKEPKLATPPKDLLVIKNHWPPFYHEFNEEGDKTLKGLEVLPFNTSAKTGDIVPVLVERDFLRKIGFVYFYKITGVGRASGDDHIVSPKEYDLEFAFTRTLEEFQSVWVTALNKAERTMRLQTQNCAGERASSVRSQCIVVLFRIKGYFKS